MNRLLGILGILVLCIELYRFIRQYWLRQLLKKKREGKQIRKPQVMKSKSERDCPFCDKGKGKRSSSVPEIPLAWSQRKGLGGPKKTLITAGSQMSGMREKIHDLQEYCYVPAQNAYRNG